MRPPPPSAQPSAIVRAPSVLCGWLWANAYKEVAETIERELNAAGIHPDKQVCKICGEATRGLGRHLLTAKHLQKIEDFVEKNMRSPDMPLPEAGPGFSQEWELPNGMRYSITHLPLAIKSKTFRWGAVDSSTAQPCTGGIRMNTDVRERTTERSSAVRPRDDSRSTINNDAMERGMVNSAHVSAPSTWVNGGRDRDPAVRWMQNIVHGKAYWESTSGIRFMEEDENWKRFTDPHKGPYFWDSTTGHWFYITGEDMGIWTEV